MFREKQFTKKLVSQGFVPLNFYSKTHSENIMSIFTPNKISARLLSDYASKAWKSNPEDLSGESGRRYLLIYDLYIKARSYAIINKLAFGLAIISSIMVLVWPSLAIVMQDFGIEMEFFKSAIVQTTVTGLAALTFAVYNHYKKCQMYVENLMRHIVYSEQFDQALIDKILKEIEKIDAGFTFSETTVQKNQVEQKTESR